MTFAILNKLRSIDINAELNKILKSLESQIITMNTDDQLFDKGITIKSVKIKPLYAASTIKTKKRKGQPTNRVTTRDTGPYHRSFKVAFGRDEFELIAFFEIQRGFELAGHLETRYGELEGLTDENTNKLIDMIRPLLINAIKQKL